MLTVDETPDRSVTRILCGRLITMTDQEPAGPQVIEIEGGLVSRIRPATDADRTAAGTVDLSHLTVLPGLIDPHTHLDFDVLAGNEAAQANVNDATMLLRMVNRSALNIRYGVTAVRLLGTRNFLDIALRKAIEAGEVPGPRIVTATRGILSTLMTDRNNIVVDTAEGIRRTIRENIRGGADLVKFFHSGSVGGGEDPCAPIYSYAELCAAVDEAHRYNRWITVHSYGGRSADECIEAGVDGIEHGFFMTAAQYDRAAEKGVWIVPTLGVFVAEPGIPDLPHWSPELRERLMRAREATWRSVELLRASGVRFALSTDAIHGPGLAREARYGVEGGLSNRAAIASITASAAEVSGLGGRAGVLTPGGFADLLAVGGDPLEDIRALEDVRFVVKGGKIEFGGGAARPELAATTLPTRETAIIQS